MARSAPIIVITGANGFVGRHLVEYFQNKGWQVRALVRRADRFKNNKNTTYYEYDLGQPLADKVFQSADYLVHTAYIKEDRHHPDAMRVNVSGTQQLLAISRKHHLKRTIFMSSMSAHENAVSGYGKQKFQLEALFDRSQDTVIRSGLVIGNGGLIKQIIKFLSSKHLAPLIDGGDQPLQVIAVYDLVKVIDAIIAKNVSGTLTIGTPEVYSYREFYLAIAQATGIKFLILPVPFILPLYVIRLVNALHLPLQVTEDNLWGLKKLQAFETLPDLQKLDITLDPLDVILKKPGILGR